MRANNLAVTQKLRRHSLAIHIAKFFFLDLVGHAADHARTESLETAARIHAELARAYEELNIPVVTVPVMPVEERVKFILGNLT